MKTTLAPDELSFLLEVLRTPNLSATSDKWKVAAATVEKLNVMWKESGPSPAEDQE